MSPLLVQLAELIRSSPLSQAEIARKSGVTPGAVSKYISGDSMPSLASIERIAAACGALVQLQKLDGPVIVARPLTPDQRALVAIVADLHPEDIRRVIEVARALHQAQPPVIDMLRATLDGPVSFARNSTILLAADRKE